jgi:hypothetical protein
MGIRGSEMSYLQINVEKFKVPDSLGQLSRLQAKLLIAALEQPKLLFIAPQNASIRL